MAQERYNAGDIQVLEGLDAVRLRPGMYIGTTGIKGLHHILWEIVDNAVDEAANGFADRIEITVNGDNSATVSDNGRGIPVDIHPQLKVSGVEVVYTQLHAGGKFNNKNYSFSGGLHGVGASVTNALSKWLNVTVVRGGKKYEMSFHSYHDKATGKVKSGVPVDHLKCVAEKCKERTGTTVTFLPDDEVFGGSVFNYEIINKRVKELAFLNKGITFVLTDMRGTDEEGNVLHEEYNYGGGLSDFVKYLNENKTAMNKPIYYKGDNGSVFVEFAIQMTNGYTENMFSYVNNIPTPEGGTHETGFKSAITKVFNDFARERKLLKDKEPNLLGEDFREGMTAVLSIKMTNVQFEGQTKTKLGNVEAKTAVESLTQQGLTEFLKKNIGVGEDLVGKAIAAARVREAARKAKEITRQKNTISNANLIGKLSSCTSKEYDKNELFIVEGDSAGGSAKQARSRKYQGILPLRGKPLNVEKKRIDQVLSNEEFRSIISALDTGIGEEFDISSLKYDKVIILSDADQDGAHIRCILLTFFYRYMKELLVEGHVYIGMPPLYKVWKKDKIAYAYDDAQLPDCINEIGKGYSLQRYKGLGEMNPEQLWETTMNPATRTLMRVTVEDAAEAERLLTTLMGDAVDARKAYIITNADFNKDADKVFNEYV